MGKRKTPISRTCCFCNEYILAGARSPAPLAGEVCCEDCYRKIVLPVNILTLATEDPIATMRSYKPTKKGK